MILNGVAIAVGDEVVVVNHQGWEAQFKFGFHIEKITPSGQIVVSKKYEHHIDVIKFNERGDEMGERFNRRSLEVGSRIPELKKKVVARNLKVGAAKAIFNVRVEKSLHTYSTESFVDQIKELEEKLAVAKEAVAKLTEINAN